MKTYHKTLFVLILPLIMGFNIQSCSDPNDPGNPGTEGRDTTDTTTGNNSTDTTTGNNTTDTTSGENTTSDLPPGYDQFIAGVEVYRDGEFIVIKSNGIPNHGSPYFEQGDARYEAYNGTNPQFRLNPNRIREQNMTFRIPVNPVEDPNHSATPLGAIGVSLNGVPFYNQYAAGNSPLTNEINGFDHYNGHPQMTGQYHYHVEPLYLTGMLGKDALLGFLLDGFPVYGPEENGTVITNDDLDDFHGHFGPTAEYPKGIYHYHITDADPYINGAGFYGVKGTVSR